MTETVVEKIESRQNHSKAWRLSDKESGCFLDVTFNIDLERATQLLLFSLCLGTIE